MGRNRIYPFKKGSAFLGRRHKSWARLYCSTVLPIHEILLAIDAGIQWQHHCICDYPVNNRHWRWIGPCSFESSQLRETQAHSWKCYWESVVTLSFHPWPNLAAILGWCKKSERKSRKQLQSNRFTVPISWHQQCASFRILVAFSNLALCLSTHMHVDLLLGSQQASCRLSHHAASTTFCDAGTNLKAAPVAALQSQVPIIIRVAILRNCSNIFVGQVLPFGN